LTEPARPGGTVRLSAAGSRDPDGQEVTYQWWIYPEAGTYQRMPALDGSNSPQVNVNLSPDATGEIHVVLEVTDNGQPPLTSYRRVVITVN
jgi:hypothetical protein